MHLESTKRINCVHNLLHYYLNCTLIDYDIISESYYGSYVSSNHNSPHLWCGPEGTCFRYQLTAAVGRDFCQLRIKYTTDHIFYPVIMFCDYMIR